MVAFFAPETATVLPVVVPVSPWVASLLCSGQGHVPKHCKDDTRAAATTDWVPRVIAVGGSTRGGVWCLSWMQLVDGTE